MPRIKTTIQESNNMNAEQIQFIKDWYNDPTTTKKERVLLEKLYPEVKESEDERIRKELVEYFINTGCNYIRGVPIENVIAYLEKQKESNPSTPEDIAAAYQLGLTEGRREQMEVDLDFQVFAKEMDAVFNLPIEETENTEENPLNWEYAIARHFYELGLNARKEE